MEDCIIIIGYVNPDIYNQLQYADVIEENGVQCMPKLYSYTEGYLKQVRDWLIADNKEEAVMLTEDHAKLIADRFVALNPCIYVATVMRNGRQVYEISK